jgi:hypothetical protein
MDGTTQLLQSALTPAFLLVALGSMLNLYTGRLSRIIDRSRDLQKLFDQTEGEDHSRVVAELRDLHKRIQTVNSAIALGVLSAITVSILIAILFLMGIAGLKLATYAAFAFLFTICLLAASLLMFMAEVRLAIRNVRVSEKYLELPERKKRRRD